MNQAGLAVAPPTLAGIHLALRRYRVEMEAVATRHDLSLLQFDLLLALSLTPARTGLPAAALADQLGTSRRRVTPALRHLRTSGYVSGPAASGGSPGTAGSYSLSTDGRRVLDHLHSAHHEAWRTHAAPLASHLRRVRATLPPEQTYASPACAMPEIVD